jgi:DNA-binding beta-propeller fold protein YncE
MGVIIILFLISFSNLGEAGLKFLTEFGGKGSAKGEFGKRLELAFDREGRIYICDTDNARVQIFSPAGQFIKEITSTSEVTLHEPQGIAVSPEGGIYVVDWLRHLIKKDPPEKIYQTLACIRVFNSEGKWQRNILLDKPSLPKELAEVKTYITPQGEKALVIEEPNPRRPFKIALSREKIFVLDQEKSTILCFNKQGEHEFSFGNYGGGKGELDCPSSLTSDLEGNLWVADSGNHRVVKFSPRGEFLLSIGKKGLGKGEFVEPKYINVSLNNEVLVFDTAEYKKVFSEHPFEKEEFLHQRLFKENPKEETLRERIESLERALNEEKGEKKEPPPKYTTVIYRVQVFNTEGKFLDKILYKVDKSDPELCDLTFLAIDRARNIYLRDESRYTIRKYQTFSYFFKLRKLDTAYAVRGEAARDRVTLDFWDPTEDIDKKISRTPQQLQQALSFRYDLTEGVSLFLKGRNILAGEKYQEDWLLSLPESLKARDRALDTTVDLKFQYITNPNKFSYQETNVYLGYLDGFFSQRITPLYEETTHQKRERLGDAKGFVFGFDTDLSPKANLKIEFLKIQPKGFYRNTRIYFYDERGDLYTTGKYSDVEELLIGEFRIKF